MHVLLTEDNALIASGIAGLEAQGFSVAHAATTAQTDALLRSARFDLLILDLGLPDEDGLHVLHRLRRRGLELPVLIRQLAIADASQQAGPPIELHAAEDVSRRVLAMPPALAIAALRNLLDNARRHTRDGTTVRLMLEQLGENKVGFIVQDHPAETVQRFTERFWRSSEGEGSGLGLSIVKAIAERCGCELRFSTHDDGLRVEFFVDLQPARPSNVCR